MTHRQASEWLTPAAPHAAGTSAAITACYCCLGLEERVGWSDRKTGRKDERRCSRSASLSGHLFPSQSQQIGSGSSFHTRQNKPANRLQIPSVHSITGQQEPLLVQFGSLWISLVLLWITLDQAGSLWCSLDHSGPVWITPFRQHGSVALHLFDWDLSEFCGAVPGPDPGHLEHCRDDGRSYFSPRCRHSALRSSRKTEEKRDNKI